MTAETNYDKGRYSIPSPDHGQDPRWQYPYYTLPYTWWTCADDREVLLDRKYCPIWQRQNGIVTPADPRHWVRDVTRKVFLYTDGNAPSASRGTRLAVASVLKAFLEGQPIQPVLDRYGIHTEPTEEKP